MREHLRFSTVYWHTFRATGADPFGAPTLQRPWDDGSDSVDNARERVRVAFEFMAKLGTPYYAFHDRDVAPEGASLRETNRNLDAVVEALKAEQERTGIRLLWGTANLFSHPRYVHGAATSCNADAFAFAASQVKKCMEVTLELGGRNYVFWGGRGGLPEPAEHGHEARAGPPGPVPAPGGRPCRPHRLRRHPAGRAEAQGAHQAPVRLRRRRLHQLPARLRPDRALQAQHRDQPRDAGRPRDGARAGVRRRPGAAGLDRQPTPATCCWAGTPTSSRPAST